MTKKHEEAEFPITLEEYLQTVAKPESRAAFSQLCKKEGIEKHRLSHAWTKLFKQFQSKPVGVTWDSWTKGGE